MVQLGNKTSILNPKAFEWSSKISLAVTDQCLFSGANFVVSIQLARWMSPDEYGAYSYAFSVFFLISGFYNVLLLEPMSIFGPVKHRGNLISYLRGLTQLHIGWSAISCVIISLAAGICLLVQPGSELASAFLGFGLAQGMILFFWFVRRAWYMEHQVRRALVGTVNYSITLIGGTWALQLVDWVSPFTAFLVNGGAALVAGSNLIFLLYRGGQKSHQRIDANSLALENWKYGRWLVLSSVVYWLTGNVYYVLTGSMLSLADAGALRALQNLTNPILQVVTALGLLFMPWISRRFAAYGRDALKKGILMFSVASTGLALAFLIVILPIANILIQVFYKGKYNECAWLLPYLALVPVIVGLSSGWVLGLRILGKTSSVFIVDIVGAVLTLTAGVALVKEMGLTGAAVGTVLSAGSRLIVLPWLWARK